MGPMHSESTANEFCVDDGLVFDPAAAVRSCSSTHQLISGVLLMAPRFVAPADFLDSVTHCAWTRVRTAMAE